MTHLHLKKTRSAYVLQTRGPMSTFQSCFFPCRLIWKRRWTIQLTLFPTFLRQELWTLECVFQHNLCWDLTFRPLKPRIQSKVWVRANKVHGRPGT